MAQQLFAGTPLSVLFDNTNNNIEEAINKLTDAQVLAASLDALTQQIADSYSIQVPVLDLTKVDRPYEDATIPERRVPNPNFADIQIGVPGRVHTLHVPYTGQQHMFYYMPPVPPRLAVVGATTETEVMVYAAGAWFTAESITQKFQQDLETLEDALRRLRENCDRYNTALPTFIRPRLDKRHRTAEQTRQTTEGIKFPLRQVANPPQTYKLPEKPKQIAPQPVKAPAKPDEFVLPESDYQDILRICESMSLVMERSPTVFENAEEEHIRVHYLVQLNGQYQGEATGETFNHKGKTDILIRHKNQNVFVAECKFWSGHKALIETADQLLGYTTWRDTRTALIIFNRNVDFSKVISEAQRAMKDHQHYKSGPTKQGETIFRYVFTHPDDKQRDIIVTLMLFNMPKPQKPSG
jgi:hypothetical protein